MVFNGAGEREAALAAAARSMLGAFERLLRVLLPPGGDGAPPAAGPAPEAAAPCRPNSAIAGGAEAGGAGAGGSAAAPRGRRGALLATFDDAWVAYLEQFATWKGADAGAGL